MAIKLAEFEEQNEHYPLFVEMLQLLDLPIDDLQYLELFSPYLILDGHRSGTNNNSDDEFIGYIEGANFSLRFSQILLEMGGKQATFLMHTLRNYNTPHRMNSIFKGVQKIGEKFIRSAAFSDIKLKYHGKDVHTNYTLSNLINTAEQATKRNKSFELNFLTNYSESWAIENMEEIQHLPDINLVARFTKGHYSGAGIPTKMSKANFLYVQQASISSNWTDEEIMLLILSMLKSFLSINGYIGSKSYSEDEKSEIYRKRETESWSKNYDLRSLFDEYKQKKHIHSYTPLGPFTVNY